MLEHTRTIQVKYPFHYYEFPICAIVEYEYNKLINNSNYCDDKSRMVLYILS